MEIAAVRAEQSPAIISKMVNFLVGSCLNVQNPLQIRVHEKVLFHCFQPQQKFARQIKQNHNRRKKKHVGFRTLEPLWTED